MMQSDSENSAESSSEEGERSGSGPNPKRRRSSREITVEDAIATLRSKGKLVQFKDQILAFCRGTLAEATEGGAVELAGEGGEQVVVGEEEKSSTSTATESSLSIIAPEKGLSEQLSTQLLTNLRQYLRNMWGMHSSERQLLVRALMHGVPSSKFSDFTDYLSVSLPTLETGTARDCPATIASHLPEQKKVELGPKHFTSREVDFALIQFLDRKAPVQSGHRWRLTGLHWEGLYHLYKEGVPEPMRCSRSTFLRRLEEEHVRHCSYHWECRLCVSGDEDHKRVAVRLWQVYQRFK